MSEFEERFNKAEAAAALKKIFRPCDVFEIRALDAQTTAYSRPHTVSGYFDYAHIDHAVELIERDIRFARGIYYTPNPVEPALLARAANRFRDMGQRDPSTADQNIPRRRWLLIDCDAIRPSGISSSDAEHAAALDKASEIRDGLASMGFPEPVEIDSGNGAQLMYSVDLPGGVEDTICKGILQRLQSCNTPAVDIDETVFNASRIWRLPGSANCKGDPIPERPHRRAQIIRFPEELKQVPLELLKNAAGIQEEKPFDPAEYQNGSGAKLSGINFAAVETRKETESFDLDRWIAQYCPEAEGPQPWQDGRKWIFPVCPFNEEHRNRSAIITEQASGAVGFVCHHNGCKGNDWRALRELREPGFIDRELERQNAATAKSTSAPIEPPKQEPPPEPLEVLPEEEPEEEQPAPWRDVSTDDIRGILEGTLLGEMVKLFSCVTVPALPLEAALLKAIVTVGCAFSQQGAPDIARNGLLPSIGAMRARLRINTAGGQVCNVYALLAANSASGKDIGNLIDAIAAARNWNLGTSGSAEGIAEALKNCPNGMLTISEMENWLDEKHWQHKATSFLTEAFGKGYFKHNFSSRGGKGGQSTCEYCFPSIMANIQPKVFENIVREQDISSGFLGRFLYAKMPEFFGDPTSIDLSEILQQFAVLLPRFEMKHGVVEVPEGYGTGLSDMFKKYSPEKLHPVWRRLVNEYMPRLACMLSVNHAIKSQGEMILLESSHWAAAEKMVLWFFGNAENMLSQIEDETAASKLQEKLMRRIAFIIAKYDRGQGVGKQTISRQSSHTGTTSMQRSLLLQEMIDRGWISCSAGEKVDEKAKYKILSLPPGILG